jgi:uncharacterized protein DUF5610
MDILSTISTGSPVNGFAKQPEDYKGYSLTTPYSQNPIQLLESELGKSLSDFTPIAELNALDFTPVAVADRILGFVETAIAQRAGSEIEAQSLLQQAKEGIAQGFAQAREILETMPQMTDEINSQINETEALIFQRLDQLQSNSAASPEPHLEPQRGMLISESASASSQFRQSSEATIEIVTRDGDKVEVSYSALIQSVSSQAYAANEQGASAAYEFSTSSSSAFQFSVQGNIDEGEQQAINQLLSEVGDLASQFFNGDVQAAFNSALDLGFDSRELQSFALDFQQSTYVEVVQTYQRTEQINAPISSIADSGTSPGPAIDMLAQFEQFIQQAKENAVIEQPETTIKSLLSDMLDLLSEDDKSSLHGYINDIIKSV